MQSGGEKVISSDLLNVLVSWFLGFQVEWLTSQLSASLETSKETIRPHFHQTNCSDCNPLHRKRAANWSEHSKAFCSISQVQSADLRYHFTVKLFHFQGDLVEMKTIALLEKNINRPCLGRLLKGLMFFHQTRPSQAATVSNSTVRGFEDFGLRRLWSPLIDFSLYEYCVPETKHIIYQIGAHICSLHSVRM